MATEFAEIFSKLRKARNISQRKAAEDLNVSQALLSHYENGLREPRLDFVVRACAYYGVSADYLLGRASGRGDPLIAAKEAWRLAGEDFIDLTDAEYTRVQEISNLSAAFAYDLRNMVGQEAADQVYTAFVALLLKLICTGGWYDQNERWARALQYDSALIEAQTKLAEMVQKAMDEGRYPQEIGRSVREKMPLLAEIVRGLEESIEELAD